MVTGAPTNHFCSDSCYLQTQWFIEKVVIDYALIALRVPSPPLSTATVEARRAERRFVSGADSGGSPLLRRPFRRRRSGGVGNRPPVVHTS